MTQRPPVPGATTTQVAVDGVRFHLTKAGPARKRRTTPVLLLHGVPETAVCWRALVPELAKDRVVLAPDLKGLGESEARGPYDLGTVAAELAALVLHEAGGPVDVVGHDFGGSAAIALAAARPDLVRRLVDISGPYRKVDLTKAWHIPFFTLPLLPEAVLALRGGEIWRGALVRGWKSANPMPPEVLDHYVSSYTPADRVAAALSYYRDTTRPRLWRMVTGRRPGEPRAKPDRSLVVWGADDPFVSVADGEDVVRLLGAGADMLTLPGVGHFPVEEAPDVVVPAVAEFLRAP